MAHHRRHFKSPAEERERDTDFHDHLGERLLRSGAYAALANGVTDQLLPQMDSNHQPFD
jgi:hypothetical protein